MQNADKNPTQAQQQEMAAKSPAKTPAAGADTPDAKTQAREFGSKKNASAAEAVAAKNPAPLPQIDEAAKQSDAGDPVVRANKRIVSVDNAGMAASDNTVDTDAKGLEARRDMSAWHDNVVFSNATLENNVPMAADGLADLDSRPEGNFPLVAMREGWQFVYQGTVNVTERNGTRAEHVFVMEPVAGGGTHTR